MDQCVSSWSEWVIVFRREEGFVLNVFVDLFEQSVRCPRCSSLRIELHTVVSFRFSNYRSVLVQLFVKIFEQKYTL